MTEMTPYVQGYYFGYHQGAHPDENPFDVMAKPGDHMNWEIGRLRGREDWRNGSRYQP